MATQYLIPSYVPGTCSSEHKYLIILFSYFKERCLARGAASGDSKRTDDNEESLKKRFVTFTNATQPIIKHFEEQDMVKTVNAERSVDEVWADVEKLFQ